MLSSPQDDTCDPSRSSWVPSASIASTDFPLQNLPFGVFSRSGEEGTWQIGVAIGQEVLDVRGCASDGLLGPLAAPLGAALAAPTLNQLLGLGSEAVGQVRRLIHSLLREDAAHERRERTARYLVPASRVRLGLPTQVGDFTDFFASVDHALRVVRLRNPDATLPASYPYAPLAYHGRAGTMVPTGTAIQRPYGPSRGPMGPRYAPTGRLDHEAELGLVVAGDTTAGRRLTPAEARHHIAGVCLLNDWSARDVQGFEAQPLGPFLSKSFATTMGAWMVTRQALAPFRRPAAPHPAEWPGPLPHLLDALDQQQGAWAITVEVSLQSRVMRELDLPAVRLSMASAASLFWTPAQLVSHQTANGCRLRSGDIIATGTVSGPDEDGRSTLVEITRGGREALVLPSGESRAYLHDGDEVLVRGWCEANDAVRIGFGECRGEIVAAEADDGRAV